MSVNGDFYRFDSGDLVRIAHSLPEGLDVADSFLVQDGQTVALERHLARFQKSVNFFEPTSLELFFEVALRHIPMKGAWFPRLEYRATQPVGQRLYLRLREAPERFETVTLWTLPDPDTRVNPSIKGPDLALGQQLRRTANLHGADEAVLLTPDGYIAEGALSSIVWVKDGALYLPDDSTPWLPSITRSVVADLAKQAGLAVHEVRAKPNELAGSEVWSLSALQGIRGVTRWSGVAISQPKLYLPFRKRLQMLLRPIDAH